MLTVYVISVAASSASLPAKTAALMPAVPPSKIFAGFVIVSSGASFTGVTVMLNVSLANVVVASDNVKSKSPVSVSLPS